MLAHMMNANVSASVRKLAYVQAGERKGESKWEQVGARPKASESKCESK